MLLVQTFEETGILMLVMVFLFSHLLATKINVFNNFFLFPIEDIDFLNLNLTRYFSSDYFFL